MATARTAIVKRVSEDEYVVTFYFPYDAVDVSEQKKKDPNYKSVREIVMEN